MKLKIKLDETRSKLNEGRCRGLGCAFLKKIGEGEFIAVQPISPCKDYLNDVVYSEVTGKPYSAYGLQTKKQDIFDTHAYLAIATCGSTGGTKHAQFDEEEKLLAENIVNAQKVLNDIETLLKIEDKTELISVDKNLVFAKIPLAWVKNSWLISLWSLLHRNAIYSKGGDPFQELNASRCGGDSMYIPNAIEKIKKFMEKGLPVCKDMDALGFVHNVGIMAYNG